MTDPERDFVEAMGRHFEAEGVPRIGGRMLGFLLLREGPCSLDDLVSQLEVSKASASTNARLLEQWALVARTSVPGDRRDYYVAVADPARALEFRMSRVRDFAELLRRGADAGSSPAVTRRLAGMARFHDEAITTMEPLIARWRDGEPS